MLLILYGLVGGLIAFGFLGIFIGPTVLAVTYTLLPRVSIAVTVFVAALGIVFGLPDGNVGLS